MHTPDKRGWLSGSYIGRHWRGELSLPISYFVNGLLGTAAASTIVLAISATVSGSYRPWSSFVIIVGIWSFLLLVSLWQLVGIWRSADNHPKRGGRTLWANIAKFMVIIGALQTAVTFGQNGWPQIKEGFRIVAGDPTVGTFALRLMNGGTEIEYVGGIPFGAVEELVTLLNAAPEVHTIHLDSDGGRVAAAEKLKNLIRERKLNTYVSSQCLSACTIAYLGGRERYLHRLGRLGFHSSSFPGVTETDMRPENQRIASEAEILGVERRFAEKAYLSPPDSMWFPTSQELIKAGVVTRMASGQFAISGFGRHPSRDAIAGRFMENSLFAAVSDKDLHAFKQIINILFDGVVKGEPEIQVFARTRSIISDLVSKYAPLASNKAILTLGTVFVDELEAIDTRDKLACHAFLFPQEGQTIYLQDYFTSELQKRDLEMSELIITTGIKGHTYKLSKDRRNELFEDLFTTIERRYDSWVINTLNSFGSNASTVPKEQYCNSIWVLYKEVLNLPKIEAADLLRAMLSTAEQKPATWRRKSLPLVMP